MTIELNDSLYKQVKALTDFMEQTPSIFIEGLVGACLSGTECLEIVAPALFSPIESVKRIYLSGNNDVILILSGESRQDYCRAYDAEEQFKKIFPDRSFIFYTVDKDNYYSNSKLIYERKDEI